MSNIKSKLHMFSRNVPKPIRYIIANMLSYSDLKNLSLTNKECFELCRDDNYWKSRIRCKLGTVPESAKVGEYKKWYINNVNNIYLQNEIDTHPSLNLVRETPRETPRLFLENVKSLDPESWNSCGYFVIDSFGNLNYFEDSKTHIATNVKTFVVDRPLPIGPDDYTSGVYYIDDKDDLYMIMYQGETKRLNVPVKLAQNVSFAGIWDHKYKCCNFGILYYISDHVLYEMNMVEYNTKESLFIIKNIEKLINFMDGTFLFIDTNNNLKIGAEYDILSTLILVKGVKNAYIKKTHTETFEDFGFQLYYIDMNNNLYKIKNLEEYVGVKQGDVELESELIFENVKDYGHFFDVEYVNEGDFSYELILTKNGNLYTKVGENPFTFVLKNVNKIFDNLYYSMLLFSVVV